MRSTFHGLETAKRSLFTQQAALHTTGHNIANANTKGYSRQVVNMVAARPIEAYGLMRSTVPGQLGTGVEFNSITRIREAFLDDQFRNENQSLGSWTIRQDTLEKLETIFNEPSETGLNTVIADFWKAWSDLSKDPENIEGKKVVRETAMALADAFNTTSKRLQDLHADLTENINVNLNQINTIISNVANLNTEIRRIEGLGDNANDLRDQRDLLVDELSKLINVNVQETDTGYRITMGNVELVNGGAATLQTVETLTAAYNAGNLSGGEVHGMIVSRDVYVVNYMRELDLLANRIATGEVEITIPAGSVLPEGTVLNGVTYTGANRILTSDLKVKVNGINQLHQLGYHFTDPYVGGEFFTAAGGGAITAANFQLNPLIADNPNLIATSLRTVNNGSGEEVVKGNNTLALLMAGLKDGKFNFATTPSVSSEATVDDYFRSVIGQLGVQTKEAIRQAENSRILVEQVDFRRQSVSGVSLDEEMANLIRFQHAYNAAARTVTAVDEMLDRVINGMGIVGR